MSWLNITTLNKLKHTFLDICRKRQTRIGIYFFSFFRFLTIRGSKFFSNLNTGVPNIFPLVVSSNEAKIFKIHRELTKLLTETLVPNKTIRKGDASRKGVKV